MLEAINLSVRFGLNFMAVDDVSIAVRPGELLALCGPNGAGKSTLLSTLAGDLSPSSGMASLDGDDISGFSAEALARRRAVLEQAPSLSAAFTVGELVALSVERECPPERTSQIVAAAISEVELMDRFGDRADRLSGGQRHRAHLARVLAQLRGGEEMAGRYLLLDEPTSSLDMKHQIAIMRIARDAACSGAGVLVVIHDLNLAAAFSDRIGLMHRGRLVSCGSPGEVFTAARLGEIYETELAVSLATDGRPRIQPVYTA
jgi:iron complex transport system ATP-binding protein